MCIWLQDRGLVLRSYFAMPEPPTSKPPSDFLFRCLAAGRIIPSWSLMSASLKYPALSLSDDVALPPPTLFPLHLYRLSTERKVCPRHRHRHLRGKSPPGPTHAQAWDKNKALPTTNIRNRFIPARAAPPEGFMVAAGGDRPQACLPTSSPRPPPHSIPVVAAAGVAHPGPSTPNREHSTSLDNSDKRVRFGRKYGYQQGCDQGSISRCFWKGSK